MAVAAGSLPKPPVTEDKSTEAAPATNNRNGDLEKIKGGDTHLADIMKRGKMRVDRAHKGRAAKYRKARTWYYHEWDGVVMCGDEVLLAQPPKPVINKGSMPIKCVVQNDDLPTVGQLLRTLPFKYTEKAVSTRRVFLIGQW